jgi:hypothetical protein
MATKIIFDDLKTGIDVNDPVTIQIKDKIKQYKVVKTEDNKQTTAAGISGYTAISLEQV